MGTAGPVSGASLICWFGWQDKEEDDSWLCLCFGIESLQEKANSRSEIIPCLPPAWLTCSHPPTIKPVILK